MAYTPPGPGALGSHLPIGIYKKAGGTVPGTTPGPVVGTPPTAAGSTTADTGSPTAVAAAPPDDVSFWTQGNADANVASGQAYRMATGGGAGLPTFASAAGSIPTNLQQHLAASQAMFGEHAPEISAGIASIGTRVRTGIADITAATTPEAKVAAATSMRDDVRATVAGMRHQPVPGGTTPTPPSTTPHPPMSLADAIAAKAAYRQAHPRPASTTPVGTAPPTLHNIGTTIAAKLAAREAARTARRAARKAKTTTTTTTTP